jgi:hypothetical protein
MYFDTSVANHPVPGTTESARTYFARLSLRGQTRAVLARWQTLSAASYFVAWRLPQSVINVERQPCTVGTLTLGELFQNLAAK